MIKITNFGGTSVLAAPVPFARTPRISNIAFSGRSREVCRRRLVGAIRVRRALRNAERRRNTVRMTALDDEASKLACKLRPRPHQQILLPA